MPLRGEWQQPRGFFHSVRGSKCAICGSTFDNGFSRKHGDTDLCHFHSCMTLPAIELIIRLKKVTVDELKYISKEQFMTGRWNSYDRDALVPYFSNELLAHMTRHCIVNCSRVHMPAHTYDDALQLYAAELVQRISPVKNDATDDVVDLFAPNQG